MRYGFRLFRMQVLLNGRVNRDHTTPPWDAEARRRLRDILNELSAAGDLRGTPRLRSSRAGLAESDDEGELEKNPPSVEFLDFTELGERHLHFHMSVGNYGHHQDLHRGGQREDIRDGAATARHRVDVFLPDGDDGFDALVAIESVGGSSPNRLLRGHLAKRARGSVADPSDPKKRSGSYHSYRLLPQPDAAWLRDAISRTANAKAVFRDTEPSARGRTSEVLRTIEINLLTERYRDGGVKNATDWLDALLSDDGDTVSMTDAVDQMIGDFELDTDGLAALEFDIDEVALVLEDENGNPKTYTPALIRQFFTYPVSTTPPGNVHYYERVIGRVQSVLSQYPSYEITPATAAEVEAACQTASIRDRSSEPASEPSVGEPTLVESQETGSHSEP